MFRSLYRLLENSGFVRRSKDLQKDCDGVIVTLDQSNADYTVILNRESKHNRGLLRTNSQVQVANRVGDIIGTNATRAVGNASKDACQLVLSNWRQHGRITAGSAPAPVIPQPAESKQTVASIPVPKEQAKTESPPLLPSTREENYTEDAVGAGAGHTDSPANNSAVEISSVPAAADIEIDGNFVGATPSSPEIESGQHRLRISKKGYGTWERTVTSTSGNIKIAAELERLPDSAPSATQAIDKKDDPVGDIATTPTSRSSDSTGDPPEEVLIGIWFKGNPTVRHDGIEICGVRPNGPADSIEMKPGDVLLAIDDHYLFTIDEVRDELLHRQPGSRLRIRYRRNQLISENYLTINPKR